MKPALVSVHPEMVDFGSGQGRGDFATAGVVGYAEDCEERERRHGPKDAFYGWALVSILPYRCKDPIFLACISIHANASHSD
jgi:hypothetical protein